MPEPQGASPAPPPPPQPPPPLTQGFWRQLPNTITVLRVVLAAGFFAVLTPFHFDRSPLARGETPDRVLLTALVLFVLAAMSDAVDGYLARRWGAITTFGRIMDPFADKFLIIGGFVYLAGPGFVAARFKESIDTWGTASVTAVQAWMVAVILGRELLVTSIRAVFEARGVEFPSNLSGKLKMILQSLCIPAVLLLLNVPHAFEGPPGWAAWTIRGIVWVTVAVTAYSGIPYAMHAIRVARGEEMAAAQQMRSRAGLSRVGELLITTLGLGYLRPAPGTWGSLPTVVLAGVLLAVGISPDGASWLFNLTMLLIAAAGTVVCAAYGDAAEARFLRKDPSSVVADETAGQAVALLLLPAAAFTTAGRAVGTLVLAFLLFRALDILKPYPANRVQRAPGGWGIVLDDLVAGAYAMVLLQIVTRVLMAD